MVELDSAVIDSLMSDYNLANGPGAALTIIENGCEFSTIPESCKKSFLTTSATIPAFLRNRSCPVI